MRDRKRKFEPSEDLRTRLLELAGISVFPSEPMDRPAGAHQVSPSISEKTSPAPVLVSPTNRSPEELNADAVNLKHQADKASGASKYLLYIKSGLRFMERAALLESAHQSRAFRTVGNFLSQCAHHAERKTEDGAFKARHVEHLIVFSLQLAAISYMRSFSNRSKKLKMVRDLLSSKLKNQKASIHSKSDDRENLKYFVDEFNDVLMSVHLWKKSEQILLKAETSNKGSAKRTFDLIPTQQLYVSNSEVHGVVQTIRNALEQMY